MRAPPRKVPSAVLAVVLCSGALAGDRQGPRQVVAPKYPLTDRIAFVLDSSASMAISEKMPRLLSFVRSEVEQPLDRLEVAVWTFNDSSYRWDGYPDSSDDPKPVPKGWAKLPSEDASRALREWLARFPGDGCTYPNRSLSEAIAEPREGLSIVFATDGDFSCSSASTFEAVEKEQRKRAAAGLGTVPILVVGIGSGASKQENLAKLGKDWGGGFFAEDDPAPVSSRSD